MMTLLFGRLTEDFVNFTQALSQARQNMPDAADNLSQAASNFRHAAAKNACYLVYIGRFSSEINYPVIDNGIDL